MREFPARKILTVFLASPGDVLPERKLARDLADKVNRVVAWRLGWHLELRGWEDLSPGFGRPQGLINREQVETCHLFVGLLWKKWGTPTGEYSSGFEEEFESALRRKRETDSPQICIFFKQIDESYLAEPGPQLLKVLEFRNHLIESKELYFGAVEGPEDWVSKLEDLLTKTILEEYQRNLGNPEMRTPPAPVHETVSGPLVDVHGNPVPSQLLDVLLDAKDRLALGSARVFGDSESSFKVSRLALLASTWMSAYTGELLSSHQMNHMYLHRHLIELTADERRLITRSLIHDNAGVVPGWFWLRDFTNVQARFVLFYFAVHDSDESVKIGAIHWLGNSGIRPVEQWMRIATRKFYKESSPAVRKAWVEYLGKVGSAKDIPALTRGENDPSSQVRTAVLKAKLTILSSSRPEEALRLLLVNHKGLDVDEFLSTLRDKSDQLNIESLQSALSGPDESLRAFALRELSRRGAVEPDRLTEYLSDSSVIVKEIAARELIGSNPEATLPIVEKSLVVRRWRLVADYYSKLPIQELQARVDFFSVGGSIAYRVLAERHDGFIANKVRRDLDDQFEALRDTSVTKLTTLIGEQTSAILQSLREVEGMLRNKFIAAALTGLALKGVPSDIEYGRRWIESNDDDVTKSALHVLGRFGDSTDVESVLRVLASSYGEVKKSAARVALKLSEASTDVVQVLLNSEDRTVVALTFEHMVAHEPSTNVYRILSPYLNHEGFLVRARALAHLISRCRNDTLEQCLNSYVANPTHYYDVVSWLDKVLYAPEGLKRWAKRQLHALITEMPTHDALLDRLLDRMIASRQIS